MLPRETALENLKDIRNVLNKYDISYWLDGGTCLGAIREHDFIEWDEDTDIGVLEETFKEEAIYDIEKLGFKLEHTYGSRDKGYELAFRRNGVKTDIFFYYLKDDKRWYAMYADKMIPMVYPAEIFATQKPIVFLGQVFMIPIDTNSYLKIKYGDYMTPKEWKGLDWVTSPLNIDMEFIV